MSDPSAERANKLLSKIIRSRERRRFYLSNTPCKIQLKKCIHIFFIFSFAEYIQPDDTEVAVPLSAYQYIP